MGNIRFLRRHLENHTHQEKNCFFFANSRISNEFYVPPLLFSTGPHDIGHFNRKIWSNDPETQKNASFSFFVYEWARVFQAFSSFCRRHHRGKLGKMHEIHSKINYESDDAISCSLVHEIVKNKEFLATGKFPEKFLTKT